MFWFCKPKIIDVYFYTSREDIFLHTKPTKAINFLPTWVKNLPKSTLENIDESYLNSRGLWSPKTIKSCPAFLNLYSAGFVIPMWCDLNIQVNSDGTFKYQYADRESTADRHYKDQITGSPFSDTHIHLKLLNPWAIYTKEKIDLLFIPAIWNGYGYEDIVSPPGLFSPHGNVLHLNVNLFLKRKQETTFYTINYGQPLYHVIPISDRKIKIHYELLTPSELSRIKTRSPMYLFDTNRLNRSQNLCKHA